LLSNDQALLLTGPLSEVDPIILCGSESLPSIPVLAPNKQQMSCHATVAMTSSVVSRSKGREIPATSGSIWQLIDSSSVGGIERHVELLADAINATGADCEVVLLADHGDNPWLSQLDDARVPYRILERGFFGLCKSIRDHRPALLHTHGYKAGILGRLAARLCGCPVVSTYHAGEQGKGRMRVYQSIDALTGCLAHGRISVATSIADKLPFATTVVPNFTRLPAHHERSGEGTIAFIGRLSPEKGPDLFCEIARRVGPRFRCAIYGDGSMRTELEKAFGDLVSFAGMVTDLSDAWPDIALVIIPSRAEGLPLVALEALAHGVPVIAADVGALSTVVRDDETGWLFPSGDVGKAADLVANWAQCDLVEKERIAHSCRDLIERDFSAAARLPDILGVYASCGCTIPSGASATIVQSSP
jgi:glycosyltransferase involved in cell wall biosynthesis